MTSVALSMNQLETTLARSAQLRDVLSSLFAQARTVVARSRELSRVYRRIRGASDVDSPFVAGIIAKTPMCVDCLGKKIGIPPSGAAETLERLRALLVVGVQSGRCSGCLRSTTIYGIDGIDGAFTNGTITAPTKQPAISKNEAVWQFLQTHRGSMYCTQCIANALFASKRIDRAVIGAEGRGARRQYGVCASCGKERLLCGLAS